MITLCDAAKNPIGVFDSGVGGLTVLEKLSKKFPREKFIYIADQGHCPYGTKTPDEIATRVEKITHYFLKRGVKAIVIACNTASVHIDAAKKITDVPIISVIQPTCATAVAITENKKVVVLATKSTANSGVYQNILKSAGIENIVLPCGEFVEFVETRELDDESGAKMVEERLAPIKSFNADVVVHGCTHFSLLQGFMQKTLGCGVKFVSCGEPTAEYLFNLLSEKGLLSDGDGGIEIYTTGDEIKARRSMKWFLTPHKEAEKIYIE